MEYIKVGDLKFKKSDLKKNPVGTVLVAIILALHSLNDEKVNEIMRKFDITVRDSTGKVLKF